MEIKTEHLIVHLFACLHLSVALGCRILGVSDELMLTLLTMCMVILLCLRQQVNVAFLAICVIAANIFGFAIGKGIALLLGLAFDSALVIYPLSTFASTEILGWSELLCAKYYLRKYPVQNQKNSVGNLRWLLVAFLTIIVIRMVLATFFSGRPSGGNSNIGVLLDYVMSCAVIIWIVEVAINSREQADKAKADANLAQYRYLKLKQQVNPHFLFNSLNVLDSLIQEQSAGEASAYTHKLADIYRYMISNEDEKTVSLREEMNFVEQYIDLIKVRWPEGLDITIDIPDNQLRRMVIPCCIQILIENATKHNAVRVDDPLVISIRTTGNSVIVSNSIHPRVSKVSSTGLGLKYIRQQYMDIADKSIRVEENGNSFTVTLPLL